MITISILILCMILPYMHKNLRNRTPYQYFYPFGQNTQNVCLAILGSIPTFFHFDPHCFNKVTIPGVDEFDILFYSKS